MEAISTIKEALSSIIGEFEFYTQLNGNNNYSWDYGAMLEYACCVLLVCVVVSAVFKFLNQLVK